jgi:hypothetical protein
VCASITTSDILRNVYLTEAEDRWYHFRALKLLLGLQQIILVPPSHANDKGKIQRVLDARMARVEKEYDVVLAQTDVAVHVRDSALHLQMTD